jgi:uroporphyrinogen-III decarboxylase
MQFAVEIKDEGFVASHNAAPLIIPFDLISDFLRSMRGTMLDMYQCPEKLLAAEDKIYPFILDSAIQTAQMSGNPIIFIPLHRGSDGFMSIEQFEKFYWPYLKNIILDLIKAGLTPMPFFEGTYDQRLKYLAELPKGKILGMFDRSDLVKVKEVLKDTMCISGGMPIALLQTGTEETVKEQAKKMIDVVGKDGGFIMSSSTVLAEAKPELVKFWVDFTKEYGVYR